MFSVPVRSHHHLDVFAAIGHILGAKQGVDILVDQGRGWSRRTLKNITFNAVGPKQLIFSPLSAGPRNYS